MTSLFSYNTTKIELTQARLQIIIPNYFSLLLKDGGAVRATLRLN